MRYRAASRIRFGDVDHARIMYYPRFFDLFHRAFEDFFTEALKLDYQVALNEDNVGFPSVHAEADYFCPLRFGDAIETEVTIEDLGKKSVTFIYQVYRSADQRLCARGKVVVVTVDFQTLQSVPIPTKYREHFEAYRQASAC